MTQYTKTPDGGYLFNGGDQMYKAIRSERGVWDVMEWIDGVEVIAAETFHTRDEAARWAIGRDRDVINARKAQREAVEALTPAATRLRQEFQFQTGGSGNARYNREMAEVVEAALAEAVDIERARVANALMAEQAVEPAGQSVTSWGVVNTGTGEVMALTQHKQAAINQAHAYYGTTKEPVAARQVVLRVVEVIE